MRRRRRRSDCPIHFALEVFGDAWSLLIVRDLMFKGMSTYNHFLRAGEGVATNILADRLVRLEQDGVIAQEVPAGGSGRSRYRLTPKGIDLVPTMLEIIAWSAKYDPNTAAPREFVRRVRTEREALAREIRAALRAREGTCIAQGASPKSVDRKGGFKPEVSS